MTERQRDEVSALLKQAEEQRRKIKELQTELELLMQEIARSSAHERKPERRKGTRKAPK